MMEKTLGSSLILSGAMRRSHTAWLAVTLSLVTVFAPSALGEPKEEEPEPPVCSEVAASRRALALGAAVVPGVLVHGSGSYVLGCPETAKTLLFAEAAGLGLAVVGAEALMLTGAARSLAGLGVATVATGGGLLLSSWLADIYAVTAPPGGWGRAPTRVPAVETGLGYAHVMDPRFRYRHFQVSRLDARAGRWRLAPSLWTSPDDKNSRWRLLAGYRILGGTTREASQDGSFVELQAALTEHRFPAERFAMTTTEWFARGRIDLGRLDPKLLGAFAELGVGSALQLTRFDYKRAETTGSSLLLHRFALGVYLGDPRRGGGEGALFYDHRHDGFAGGMLMPGLGSGAAGHMGVEASYYVDEHWGLGLGSSVGSATVVELTGRFRQWGTP